MERKRQEQKRQKLDPKEIEKKLEAYELKFQNRPTRLSLIKEIKKLLHSEKPKEDNAIKSLSFQFNDVIMRARQVDIDPDILALLREKQQPLIAIIREHRL